MGRLRPPVNPCWGLFLIVWCGLTRRNKLEEGEREVSPGFCGIARLFSGILSCHGRRLQVSDPEGFWFC